MASTSSCSRPPGAAPARRWACIAVLMVAICTYLSHLLVERGQSNSGAETMNAVAVECIGIGLAYGTNQVLKDITLAIQPGEFFALLGPSGCGKTTLLRLIAGFDQPTGPRRWSTATTSRGCRLNARNVGMVFQSYALWPHMTVRRQRRLRPGGAPRAARRDRRASRDALDLVGLSAYAKRRPSAALGRTAAARGARAHHRHRAARCCCSTSRCRTSTRSCACRCGSSCAAAAQLGITTIFVTHDQEEAMTICDRIAVMKPA